MFSQLMMLTLFPSKSNFATQELNLPAIRFVPSTTIGVLVLSPEEAGKFIKACKGMPNGMIFELALETGMRPEEYLGLRWRDVGFADNTVSVAQVVQFYQKGGGFYFDKPKTAKSARMIPISRKLRDGLMAHKIHQNDERLKINKSYAAHNLVFANIVGNPYPLNNLTRRYFRPIVEKLDLDKKISLYSLRHTCATLLLIAGENPKVVADRLGHAKVNLVLDTYSHILPGIQESATKKLDNILRIKRRV